MKKASLSRSLFHFITSRYDWIYLLEAPPRFELGMEVLQTSALPLGHGALGV